MDPTRNSHTNEIITTCLYCLLIVGQMGDGALNGHNRPHLISDLEGCHIEELVCSQGQVLAVNLDGMVYMWGTPGDQAHIALFDPSVIQRKPEKIATFSKKKKIHAIACGRKHYVLLLSGIYAPQCYVSKGLGMGMIGKTEDNTNTKEDDGDDLSMSVSAQVATLYSMCIHLPLHYILSCQYTSLKRLCNTPFRYSLLTHPLHVPYQHIH